MAEPIVINNFTGRLTRVINGDLNSGFAKYDNSWGYNPFFEPGTLTWFKAPSNVSAIITDSSLVLDAKSRWEAGVFTTYAISDSGKIWKITGEGAGATDIATLSTGTPTFAYGASLVFYNGKIWISNDKGLSRIDFDGTNQTQVGTWNSSNFIQSTYHPLKEFSGKLYIGNTTSGTTTNIGEIDSTNLIVAQSKLSPALPVGTYVRDLDVTPDYTYLIMSVSRIPVEATAPVNDTGNGASSDSDIFYWNGSNAGVTTGNSLPSFGITALNNFSGYKYSFMYDAFGTALYDGSSKKLTLRNVKSPFPNATISNGNMVSWMSPEMSWDLVASTGTMKGGLFYYGNFDDEIGTGLWRVLQLTASGGAQIYQTPFNRFTTNRYISQNSSATTQVDSNGTHLFSYTQQNGAGAVSKFLNVFYVSPPDNSPGSWTGAVAGVYETQTQLFSKKIKPKQIRIYVKSTVSGNGFQLDLIGADGKPLSNGTFTYTHGEPIDVNRINFNPTCSPQYALAVRITNTGSVNMSIPKIEIDLDESGK